MDQQQDPNVLQQGAHNLFANVGNNQFQKKEGQEDFEKLKQKREDNAIEIRRDKRNQELNKKRQLNWNIPVQGQQNQSVGIQVQDAQLRAKIDEWLKQTFNLQQHFQEIMESLLSDDVYKQHYGAIGLRKLLSIEDGPPIQVVIDNNLIPRLIEFIRQSQHTHLQLECAWALTNVASGNSHQTQAIIDKGGILLFVQLLSSPHSEIAEQAIWALGNIAGDCAPYRDMILKAGGLEPLMKIINSTQNKTTVKHGTWALSNLCRGRPLPKFHLVKNAIPTLSQVIMKSQESEVLIDATWAISYLSDGDEQRIDLVIQTGVIPALVKLLDHPYLSILIPALRTLGNIVTGNESQTNMVMEEPNAIEKIFNLLNHEKRSVRREACWTLSNITAGTSKQIQIIVQNDEYIAKLKTLMESDTVEICREATWVLSNATSQGFPDDIKRLVENGLIESFETKLTCDDHRTIAVILEAINNILNCGKNHFSNDQQQNPFRIKLESIPGLMDKIEDLQQHDNNDVYNKALAILENHFDLESVI